MNILLCLDQALIIFSSLSSIYDFWVWFLITRGVRKGRKIKPRVKRGSNSTLQNSSWIWMLFTGKGDWFDLFRKQDSPTLRLSTKGSPQRKPDWLDLGVHNSSFLINVNKESLIYEVSGKGITKLLPCIGKKSEVSSINQSFVCNNQPTAGS